MADYHKKSENGETIEQIIDEKTYPFVARLSSGIDFAKGKILPDLVKIFTESLN